MRTHSEFTRRPGPQRPRQVYLPRPRDILEFNSDTPLHMTGATGDDLDLAGILIDRATLPGCWDGRS